MLNSITASTDTPSLHISTAMYLKAMDHEEKAERCQMNAVEGLKLASLDQVLQTVATNVAESLTPGNNRLLVGGSGK